MKKKDNRPHWRFVLSQLRWLSLDLWFLLPFVVCVGVVSPVFFVYFPHPYSFFVTAGISALLAIVYLLLLKPLAERVLNPESMGKVLINSLRRSILNNLFDPTISICPWLLSLSFFALWLWSVIYFSGHFIIGLTFVFIAYFTSIAWTRIAIDFVLCKRTTIALTRDVLRIASIIAAFFLVSIVCGAWGIFVTSLLFITLVYATSIQIVSVLHKAKILTTPSRQLGVRLHARSNFLQRTRWLMQYSPSVSLVFFRIGIKCKKGGQDTRKELVKAECMLLTFTERYADVINVASKYHRTILPKSQEYSETIKNHEALAYMHSGDLSTAITLIEQALQNNDSHPYFLYTRARIMWQSGDRIEALDSLEKALTSYFKIHKRHCIPASAHKAYYLSELAIDSYFCGEHARFDYYLNQARSIYKNFQGSEESVSNVFLVHNSFNIVSLRLPTITDSIEEKVGAYRIAASGFLWCLWQGAYLGARLRLALLHAIGTKQYAQTRSSLEWIEDALKQRRYGKDLPFHKRIRSLKGYIEQAEKHGWVFNDKIIFYQSTIESTSSPENIRITDRAEQQQAKDLRERVFHDLSVLGYPWVAPSVFS